MYLFETDQLGISEMGIHLLRNRYNYQTIAFEEITGLRIARGRQVNNWVLVLLFGCVFMAVGVVAAYELLHDYFFDETVLKFHFVRIVFPLLPLLLGVYAMVTALRKGYVIQVERGRRVKRFAIDMLDRQGQLEALRQTLAQHPLTKNIYVP